MDFIDVGVEMKVFEQTVSIVLRLSQKTLERKKHSRVTPHPFPTQSRRHLKPLTSGVAAYLSSEFCVSSSSRRSI